MSQDLTTLNLFFFFFFNRVRLAESSDSPLVVGYGHLGDSNLHLNVSVPQYNPQIKSLVEPYVYEWIGISLSLFDDKYSQIHSCLLFVANHKGSISAEHGIGQSKPQYLHYSKSQSAISLMKQVLLFINYNITGLNINV